MSRLQVLYLPDRQTGADEYERRFALVLDQCEAMTSDEHNELRAFAKAVGAAGAYATQRAVDCDQGTDEIDTESLAVEFREMVDSRCAEIVQVALSRDT